MNINQNKFLWFTLVELIVVITIVWILSTVWFVSYSGYLTWARDSNRISQMVKLSDSLQVYSASKTLPLPDDYTNVTAYGSWNIIWYQWEVWVDVLETLDYTNGWKDPQEGEYFSYYLTKDRKSFQLLALLENQFTSIDNNLTDQIHAANYPARFPKVYGRKLWILTGETNRPVDKLDGFIERWYVDVALLVNILTAHISDEEKITWTWSSVRASIPNGSCKRIKQTWMSRGNWIHILNLWGVETEVYCDMETEWGGWTAATMLADITTQNLFDTGNTNKITSITKDISSKWIISDIWIDDQDKDIMLQCFTNDERFKNYEIPFIIYNFKRNDIWNLEKDNKQGTVLSSQALSASWKNNAYTLSTNYGVALQQESMYFASQSNLGRVFGIWSRSNAIYKSDSVMINTPYYNTVEINVPLDDSNYCISYIK